jgi:hypothetical protein
MLQPLGHTTQSLLRTLVFLTNLQCIEPMSSLGIEKDISNSLHDRREEMLKLQV